MKKIARVAFIGSRGIPAKYGGAETFVEEISKRLVQKGFEVYVTCYSNRFGEDDYGGVIRIHTPSISRKSFTVPTINEVLATIYLLKRCPKVDVLYYVLSYGVLAASIPRLLRKKVIVNADGIEWRRLAKRRPYLSLSWKMLAMITSWYLKLAESLTAKLSNVVIADSRAIKAYFEGMYKAKNVEYISYGARELISPNILQEKESEVLLAFGLSAGSYYLTVARIVAENNILMEIEGFRESSANRKLVIIGNFNDKDSYTRYLKRLRGNQANIVFLDAIYDCEKLGILRKNCFGYIHAYEMGGTNPSLLEQMQFGKPILAYDVPYHREILKDGAIYFQDANGLSSSIGLLESGRANLNEIAAWQAKRLEEEYNWDHVTNNYVALFKKLLSSK